MTIQGKLIVFEGIEGAGKTTIVNSLPTLLTGCRVPIVICGERRSPLNPLLTGEELKNLSPLLKAYLFASDRAWTYEKECLPALRQGCCVLWDRYVGSAMVYRAVEIKMRPNIGFGTDFVRLINSPFRKPDLSFYIDVSVSTSLKRTQAIGKNPVYDSPFLEQVREEYFSTICQEGYIMLSGEGVLDDILHNISSEIITRLPDLFVH